VAAQAGLEVYLLDLSDVFVRRAIERIEKSLIKMWRKGSFLPMKWDRYWEGSIRRLMERT